MKGNPWTPAQIKLLCELYPHKRTAEVALAVGHPASSIYHKVGKKQLNICKTAEFMKSEASGRLVGGTKGIRNRFQKGHQTWNKGMKGLQIGGEETQFKKGNSPRNRKPVGTVLIKADGYSKTKIAEPNVWRLTHHLTWEKAGNELPKHPQVLRFKDGNQLNCNDINNLELSTKVEMMEKNSVQTLPPDLRKAIHLHGVLLRRINGN
jgi:hypothetical protein